VYSSGAGIALGLIVRKFLGLNPEAHVLRIDPVIPPALDGLRVQTSLLGRPVELQYRIKAGGCGVNSISLNGTGLVLDTESNPHRRGGALLAKAMLSQSLQPSGNTLVIDIG
jgi:cellobiose phosphorylase